MVRRGFHLGCGYRHSCIPDHKEAMTLTHVQVNCACGWSGSHHCPLGIRTLDKGLIARLRKILPYDYSGDDEWADADKLSEVFGALWHLEDEE